jgi:membrane-bound lytic murein transglycosylase F
MHRIILVFLLSFLGACGPKAGSSPAQPKPLTELVVLTVNSPASYFEDASGQVRGLDHDLAQEFARYLNVPLRFEVMGRTDEILAALNKQRGHLAAAALSVTAEREKLAIFSQAILTTTAQAVVRVDDNTPRKPEQLVNTKIEITASGSGAEGMLAFKQQFPSLVWREAGEASEDDLLQKLEAGDINVAVGDSHLFSLSQNFFPDIEAVFDIGKPLPVAWALPLQDEFGLQPQVNAFMDTIRANGTLKRLIDRYYGHVNQLKSDDIAALFDRARTVLPRYKQLFWQAEARTGIDWRLLAAIAYQESHWNPYATSYTGVRGMMMLTEETADRMKVTDRLDAKQSILAGAEYFLSLKESSLPPRIAEPDRTWLALAAYNQGMGHLEDARVLAQRQILSPDAWLDVKLTLPSIASPRYYKTLKHGYGRGGEAVFFVENIRNYYDILKRLEKPYQPLLQADGGDILPPVVAEQKPKPDPRTAILTVINPPLKESPAQASKASMRRAP